MNPLRSIFIAIVASALIAAATRADNAVTASLSTNTVHVGDRVTLSIRAGHAEGERVYLDDLTREPFIVAWTSDSRTAPPESGSTTTDLTIEFSSFLVGQHRVTTNHLVLVKADGSSTSLALPELLLNVESILTNPPPALAELKAPLALPGYRWLRIAGMLALVAAAAALCALLLRRWLKRPARIAPVRSLPPHDIALAALDALLKRGFIESGDAEAFYVELSAIVRIYLEERFDLQAPEQTTEEFIRTSSHSQALSPEHRVLTQAFLEQSDLVKFARFTPSADDMRAAWDAAARLVRETIPAPTPKGGTAP